MIARHLPPPVVEGGQPRVPELTAYVLQRFEGEDGVFHEFCAGVHSGAVYWGNIAEQYEKQAEAARPFLTDRIRRIREWAMYEIEHGKELSEFWRVRDEEDEMPQ